MLEHHPEYLWCFNITTICQSIAIARGVELTPMVVIVLAVNQIGEIGKARFLLRSLAKSQNTHQDF